MCKGDENMCGLLSFSYIIVEGGYGYFYLNTTRHNSSSTVDRGFEPRSD
jgi:hypothetical protein